MVIFKVPNYLWGTTRTVFAAQHTHASTYRPPVTLQKSSLSSSGMPQRSVLSKPRCSCVRKLSCSRSLHCTSITNTSVWVQFTHIMLSNNDLTRRFRFRFQVFGTHVRVRVRPRVYAAVFSVFPCSSLCMPSCSVTPAHTHIHNLLSNKRKEMFPEDKQGAALEPNRDLVSPKLHDCFGSCLGCILTKGGKWTRVWHAKQGLIQQRGCLVAWWPSGVYSRCKNDVFK